MTAIAFSRQRRWLTRALLGIENQKVSILTLLKPKIEVWILICCRYSFPTEVVGEVDKISRKLLLNDHVRNSHDHSGLQSIDITRRNLYVSFDVD